MDREQRLAEVVTAFLRAAEAGAAPDPARWLALHPDLEPELRDFFAGQARLDGLAPLLRSPAPPRLTAAFGDYELLEELGRGGMGVVYRARHRTQGRTVALKMVATAVLSRADLERFRREAEAAAQLDHPNIVPLFAVGEAGGQPYYTMKVFEGGDLSRLLAAGRPDPREAARLVLLIARAVHHAHQRGVLHRDLKPSNILLDPDGSPHVADFGLARPLEGAASLTSSGVAVGTLGYVAPEQALGRKPLTVAVDVYGLGAILYALLTGRPPFVADTPEATLQALAERVPVPPRRLNRAVDPDLQTICLKCLEEDPARRYASAEALADDLERYGQGMPIRARRTGAVRQALKWARRRPAVAALLGLVLVVAAAGVAGVFWKADQVAAALGQLAEARDQLAGEQVKVTQGQEGLARARQQFQEEQQAERQKLEAVRRGRRAADLAHGVTQARQAMDAGRWELAGSLLDDCAWDVRGWEWDYLRTRVEDHRYEKTEWRRPPRERQVEFADGGAYLVALSGDGRRVATACMQEGFGQAAQPASLVGALAGGAPPALPTALVPPRELNTLVETWDADTGKLLASARFRWPVCYLSLSADGKRLLALALSPREEPPWSESPRAEPADGSRQRPWFVECRVTEAATGRVFFLATDEGHDYWDNYALRFAVAGGLPESPRAGAALQDRDGLWPDEEWGGLALRPYQSPAPLPVPRPTRPEPWRKARPWQWDEGWELGDFPASAEAKGRALIATSGDGSVVVAGRLGSDHLAAGQYGPGAWSDRRQVVPGITAPSEGSLTSDVIGVTAVAVSPDGTRHAAGHAGGFVSLGDPRAGRVLSEQPGHTGPVMAVAFSPDGRRVFSGGKDGTVRVWDAETNCELLSLDAGAPVLALAARPDGRVVTAVCAGGVLRHWEAVPPEAPFLVRDADLYCTRAELGGRYLAVIDRRSGPEAFSFRDLSTGEPAGSHLIGSNHLGSTFAMSADGRRLACSLVYRGVLVLCSVPDGQSLWKVEEPFPEEVEEWRKQGRTVFGGDTDDRGGRRVAISPDGRRVALLSQPPRKDWPVRNPNLARVAVFDGATGDRLGSWTATFAADAHEHRNSTGFENRDWPPGLAFDASGERVVVFGATTLVAGEGDRRPVIAGHLEAVEARTGRVLLSFTTPGAPWRDEEKVPGIRAAVFSPDGTRLAAANGEWVKEWDLATGRVLRTASALPARPGGPPVPFEFWSVLALEYSPDGALLTWRRPPDPSEYRIEQWDLTGQELRRRTRGPYWWGIEEYRNIRVQDPWLILPGRLPDSESRYGVRLWRVR